MIGENFAGHTRAIHTVHDEQIRESAADVGADPIR